MISKPIIETKRLKLYQVTLNDAPFILSLLNTPLWIKFIGDRGVRTLEEAQNYIQERIIKSYGNNGFGMYLIKLKRKNIPIGLSGLVKRPTLDDVDIGYALFDDFTGNGYAFEATKAVYNYGKTALGLKRIVAIVNDDNEKSIKLLEKLGFQFEKMIQSGDDELRFYANIPPSVILGQNVVKFNFTPFPMLETARFILRPLEKTDENEIFALRSDDAINQYLGRAKAQSLEDAQNFIRKIHENLDENNAILWAICGKNDSSLIGTICLWNFEKTKVEAEIGYELLPDFHGKGILQEVIPKVIDYGFNTMKLNAIVALLDKNNVKSVRLLEKNNFKQEPVLEQDKDFIEGVYYVLESL